MTPSDQPPVLIAVFGATGTGKSTYINDASGDDLTVGHNQTSCTADVQVATPFEVDGREIWLIDTPGFDDTSVSDNEILQRIGEFLKKTHLAGQKLSGILFLHRITDIRVGGVSRRNFRVFRELCGADTLTNVVIVTNMWHNPPQEIELSREQELKSSDKFFQPVLAKGARMARYIRQPGSQNAQDIIRMCIPNIPKAPDLGEKMADGVPLGKTAAGKTLNEELQALMEKQKAEMQALHQEYQEAMRKRDMEWRQELEEEKAKSKAQIDQLAQSIRDLNSELRTERAESKADRERFQQQQEQSRQVIERLEGSIGMLQDKLQDANENEKRLIQQQIAALSTQVSNQRRGILSRVFGWLF